MKKNVWGMTLLIALTGCSQDEVLKQTPDSQKKVIHFNSKVESALLTRAFGTTWSANDSIGVFMKQADQPLAPETVIAGAENVLYTTQKGDGYFKPAAAGISWGDDKQGVDFIAYYPYTNLQEGNLYPINVADQRDSEAIDLLYSNNLTGIADQPNALNLTFSHQLSRVVFHLKANHISVWKNLSVRISGAKTQGTFNLADGIIAADENSVSTINLYPTLNGLSGTAQAILMPGTAVSDLKLVVVQDEKEVAYALGLTELEKGKQYNFNVNITGKEPEVSPEGDYLKWRETPMITESMLADEDLMYVNHYMPNEMTDPVSGKEMRNYSMLYSKKHRIAYWVAYPLFPACTGTSGRTDAWNFDPKIPASMQGNLSSGYGGNGYDRGHQLPSGDRTCDKETNKTTFYYSNMTPQKGAKLNQSIWAALENQVRSWRTGTDTVFVVTGATPPLANVQYMKEMAVPEYYFKALARKVNGTFITIGFKFDNKDYTGNNYMNEAVSVKELEDLTGFTFFPTIDASAKATLNKSQWQ